MALALGFDCCCNQVCDICDDSVGGASIRFLMTVSGITTQTDVVIPENVHSCDACEDRNVTYELTYVAEESTSYYFASILNEVCPINEDWDGGRPCVWYLPTLCGVNSVFQWGLYLFIMFYRTTAGDLRSVTGYGAEWFTLCNGYQWGIVDRLEATNSLSIDCLTYSVTDTFNVCSGSMMPACGCTPPTGFTITAEAV